MMSTSMLPRQFSALEGFVSEWALSTETERVRKRLSSSMEEIRAFYAAILPRMDEILAYLNQFPLDDMPTDAARLLYLCFSLAEVSLAVEWWGEPGVPDGYDPARWKAVHAMRGGFVHSDGSPGKHG